MKTSIAAALGLASLCFVGATSGGSEPNSSRLTPRWFDRIESRGPGSRSDRGSVSWAGAPRTPDAGYVSAFLEFLTANNPGLNTLSSPTTALCDALGTPVSGWCLNGDGTTAAGSLFTMVADGGVTTDSNLTLCPSGPDCSPITGQRAQVISTSNAGNGIFYTDSAYLMPYTPSATALSGCWFGIARALGHVITHALSAGVEDTVFRLSTNSISTTDNILAYNAGTTEQALYAPVLSCFTRAAGGYQRWKYYFNGEFKAETLPINMLGITARDTVFGSNGSPYTVSRTGDQILYGAFVTRAELSANKIRDIKNAVLPGTPFLTRNGALDSRATTTRTGIKYCTASNGAGSFVSGNVPCVSSGRYVVDPPTRNLFPSSMLSWLWIKPTAAGVLTTDATVGLGGLSNAERLECSTADGGQNCRLTLNLVLDAGIYTQSLFVKGVSASADSGIFIWQTGATPNIAKACEYNPTTWTRCENTQTATTTGTKTLQIGCTTTAGIASCAGMDVYLTGAQLEEGTRATALTPTRSVSLARGGDVLNVGTDLAGTQSDAGCFAVSWVQAGATVADAGIIAMRDGANALTQGAFNSAGPDLYVGGVRVVVGPASDAGVNTLIGRWDETSSSVTLNGVTTTGVVGVAAAYSSLWIGSNDDAGVVVQPGAYFDVRVGQTATACN